MRWCAFSQVRATFFSEHPDLIDVPATEEQICYALGGPDPFPRDGIAMGVSQMVMLHIFVELMELILRAIKGDLIAGRMPWLGSQVEAPDVGVPGELW